MGRPPTRKTRRREGRNPVFLLHVGNICTSSAPISLATNSRRIPGSGSFIRQTPSIKYGTTFTRALHSKYVEDLHESQGQEFFVLGSSNGAIEVEAANINKIRNKLSHVEHLREVSLDGENVSCANSPGESGKICPSAYFRYCSVRVWNLCVSGIRGLDLSKSLIPSWDTVAEITSELPLLERLALKLVPLILSPPTYTDVLLA